MGHSTASGRSTAPAAPRRTIAESLGLTDEQLTERSQRVVQNLTATNRVGDIRSFTIASAATNKMYNGSIFKPEQGGFVVELSTYTNGERNRLIEYENYRNITQARNAIYEATKIPKPSRRGG